MCWMILLRHRSIGPVGAVLFRCLLCYLGTIRKPSYFGFTQRGLLSLELGINPLVQVLQDS